MCVRCHKEYFALANLDVLVNTTLLSMAAVVRTDTDRTVVIATLETLESLLKFLKGVSFIMERNPLDSLSVSIQDVLELKASHSCLMQLLGKVIFVYGTGTMPRCK